MEYIKPRRELEKVVAGINAMKALDGMHIELASDERFEDFVDFILNHFFPDDILTNAVGVSVGEEQKPVWKQRYADNLSLFLVDDVTNDIIGVNAIVLRHENEIKTKPSLPKAVDEKVENLIAFLRQADEGITVFKYFGTNVVIHFRALVVRKDYRRRGLGAKLTNTALLYSKQIGLRNPCVYVEATSIFSQMIYKNLDFETLHTLYYKDFKVNGEEIFKDTGDSLATVVYAKKL